MKVLYHASTVYHVLCCISHKLYYHRKEQSVLMIVEYMLPKPQLKEFVAQLKTTRWFTEIYIVPEQKFLMSRGSKLKSDSTEEEIETVVRNVSASVEKWSPVDLFLFDEYNIAADNWSVGVFLLYHRIPYNYFEDACGILGDMERFLRIIKNFNETNYYMSQYLGGVGRSEIVQKKYCSLENQPDGFIDDRACDFTIYQCVKGLEAEDISRLLQLYQADVMPQLESRDMVLFLSQRLPTLPDPQLEIQEKMTTLMIDYLCPDSQIIVKPHPKDVWVDYHKLLPGCEVLDQAIPSELLPFVFEKQDQQRKLRLCMTPNSTSIHGLSSVCEHSIGFGNDYEKNFDSTDFSGVEHRLAETGLFRRIYHMQDDAHKKDYWNLSRSARAMLSLYPKKGVDLIVLEAEYTHLFIPSFSAYNKLFYYSLIRLGMSPQVHLYEEGITTYVIDIMNNMNNDGMLHGFYGRQSLKKALVEVLLYEPELYGLESTKNLVHPLPKIEENKTELVELYKKVFGTYTLPEQKYIFLEEAFVKDGILSTDVELVDELASIVGKDNICVKIHPRNQVNRYAFRGYQTFPSTTVPWEIVLLTNDLKDKVLVTVSSASSITAKQVLNKPMSAIQLMDLCSIGKAPHVKQKGFRKYLNRLYEVMNREQKCLYKPETQKEWIGIINYLENK